MREGIDASVWAWDLQDIADLLRRAAGSMNEVDRAQATLHVQMLQRTVDAMTLDSHLQSRRAFDMEFLVKCIVTGGFLRNASELRESLEHSLAIVVRDRRLRVFLQEQMQTLRTPSSTSMYRHRLTLHQGYCRFLGHLHKACLSSGGGVARWGTLDSSPQGAWDWLLSGATIMKASQLADAFGDANELIRSHCKGKSHTHKHNNTSNNNATQTSD